jgi:hypothetical protein
MSWNWSILEMLITLLSVRGWANMPQVNRDKKLQSNNLFKADSFFSNLHQLLDFKTFPPSK